MDATRRTGSLLRQWRQEAGISQRELADRLGGQQPAIARLEAGGVSPNMRTVERIAEALGCEVQWQMVSRGTAFNEGVPGVIEPRATGS